MIDMKNNKKLIYSILMCIGIILIIIGSLLFINRDHTKKDVTAKEEKVEVKTRDEKVVTPKLNQKSIDLTKCLNDDKSKFSLATEPVFTHATLEINADKKSVTLTSNIIKKCNPLNTHEALEDYDTANPQKEEISDFKGNIKQATFGMFSKNKLDYKIIFLMEDGTIKYMNTKLNSETKEEDGLKCTYYNFELDKDIHNLEGFENITDLLVATSTEKKDNIEEIYKTILAVNKSGYFYNMYYLFANN